MDDLELRVGSFSFKVIDTKEPMLQIDMGLSQYIVVTKGEAKDLILRLEEWVYE